MKKNGLISRGGCLPYNPKLKERARELRKNLTIAERFLWDNYLRRHELTFHRQHPIDHYIVDFYNSEYQLVIELDGSHHLTPESLEYDKQRDDILNGYGLTVLRFKNADVLGNFDSVRSEIEKYIQKGK